MWMLFTTNLLQCLTMLELLAFAMIVGQTEIAPGIIQTEYLQNSQEIVTVIEDKN